MQRKGSTRRIQGLSSVYARALYILSISRIMNPRIHTKTANPNITKGATAEARWKVLSIPLSTSIDRLLLAIHFCAPDRPITRPSAFCIAVANRSEVFWLHHRRKPSATRDAPHAKIHRTATLGIMHATAAANATRSAVTGFHILNRFCGQHMICRRWKLPRLEKIIMQPERSAIKQLNRIKPTILTVSFHWLFSNPSVIVRNHT